LMADALRAARLAPDFLTAARLVLIETSEPLIQAQRVRLAGAALSPAWAGRLEDLPAEGPLILIANALLDCLPALQFVLTERGWGGGGVGIPAGGALAYGLAPSPRPPQLPAVAEPGLVWEASPAQATLGREVGALIARRGGAALFIDYGRDAPGPGDTLQA